MNNVGCRQNKNANFTFLKRGLRFIRAAKLLLLVGFYLIKYPKNYMILKFCGATREVTGTSHLVTLDNGVKILLDCGLYQGHDHEWENYNSGFLFEPSEIDFLLVSHAHTDHIGRIPFLYKKGFRGKIYSTMATVELAELMLMDSAEIQRSDYHFKKKKNLNTAEPLYSKSEVIEVMKLFLPVPYQQWFNLNATTKIQFLDSGHILGSASISLVHTKADGTEESLGFTGDIGRPNRPILRDPVPMPPCQVLIAESTYGDKLHKDPPAELSELCRVVNTVCIENKGKLLIPAFSLGRTQELIYLLDQLKTAGKLPSVKTYIDSPLATEATSVFINHPDCYDDELFQYMKNDPNPFGFKELKYVRSVEESKSINASDEPCIIIASSGMLNAGRSQHHLSHIIEDPKNGVLIVGYCADNTPGGKLRAGKTELSLFGKKYQVKASVTVIDGFSAHGDQHEMFQIIKDHVTTAQQVFLVHGDYDVQQKYADFLKSNNFTNIEIPTLGQEFKI